MRHKIPFTYRGWILLLCCLLFSVSAFSQRTVTGKVTDQAGQPLVGTTVIIKGTNTGVTTNADGDYSIPVSGPDNVLVVSYVGYETQRIPVERSEILVRMEKKIYDLKNDRSVV